MYGINGKKFQRQYKKSISNFKTWEQKSHAEDWILYPENISEQLSLDEVALSDGELYTVLTSKTARGRKKVLSLPLLKEPRVIRQLSIYLRSAEKAEDR